MVIMVRLFLAFFLKIETLMGEKKIFEPFAQLPSFFGGDMSNPIKFAYCWLIFICSL